MNKFTVFYKTRKNITFSRNVQAKLVAELDGNPLLEHVTQVPATN
jgi:hypothetical protein